MIEVSNLTKLYGNKIALDDVSFSVQKGEILGFLGPNGAGKSTTMNILTGYLSATNGNCTINGYDILKQPLQVKKSVGYLPEIPPLYIDMTVLEYLSFVYDLKKVHMDKKAHIEQVCDIVKITDVSTRVIKNLSKGYKQRVGLASALIGNPPVLILDEPTVGLDPKQIIEIRNLIKSLGEKHTVILSSHILSEIQAVCDRIIVVSNGRLIADDTTANLAKNMSNGNSYNVIIEGDSEQVLDLLKNINNMKAVQYLKQFEDGVFEYLIEGNTGMDVRRDVFNAVVENKFRLLGLSSNELSLEDIFLKLTKEVYNTDVIDDINIDIEDISNTLDIDSQNISDDIDIHIEQQDIDIYEVKEEQDDSLKGGCENDSNI